MYFFTFSRVLWCQIVLINRCHREVILLPHQRGGIHCGVTGAVPAETEVAAILEKLLNPGFPTCLSHHNIYHPLNPLHNVQKRIRVEVSNNVGLIPIKCAYDFGSRYRPKIFDQVGHQTTYASMRNKHFITK